MQPGLIPPEVLIAASSLRDKDDLLARMKQHQEEQGKIKAQAGQLAQQHAQADVAQKQAKAAADFALAGERKQNTVQGMHQMHADFSAPPYGQPFVAPPDNAQGGLPPAPPPDQHPEMVAN